MVAHLVTAPDVVGLPFHVGRDLALDLGLALSNPDPDGRPIGSIAWPGTFYITTQSPAEGTPMRAGESIAVTVVKHGDDSVGATATVSPPPSRLVAHAEADEEE